MKETLSHIHPHATHLLTKGQTNRRKVVCDIMEESWSRTYEKLFPTVKLFCWGSCLESWHPCHLHIHATCTYNLHMPLAHARINAVQHATWCRACHLAASAAYATAFWTLLPSECCCCIGAVTNSLPVRAKCVLVLAHYGCADCTCISNHTTSYHLSHGLNRLHARVTYLHPHIIHFDPSASHPRAR